MKKCLFFLFLIGIIYSSLAAPQELEDLKRSIDRAYEECRVKGIYPVDCRYGSEMRSVEIERYAETIARRLCKKLKDRPSSSNKYIMCLKNQTAIWYWEVSKLVPLPGENE